MNFEELLNKNRIESVEKKQFDEGGAIKDLESAKNSFSSGDYDWSCAIAYNSVLRIGREFMQELGFRPIGKEHHKNVFEFLREAGFKEELINFFDNVRKLRNNFLYEFVESATKESAEEIISRAEEFVQEIRTFVQEIRTGGKIKL